MISVHAFFTDTLNTVDAVIGQFVNTVYMHFVTANSNMITLLFTVYVMWMGYQFLNHSHHFNLSKVLREMMVMLCVYGLVMNWNLYNLFVYRIFTIEPGNIAQVLINSSGQMNSTASITQALDGIYDAIINTTMNLFGQASFSVNGVLFIVYGGLVYGIGLAMCVFALMLFVYARMMMAVTLALGPLFILFILWQPTKGLFSAWLNKLITLALIPIITSSILMLMLSVVNVTLPAMNVSLENQQFYGLAPFLALCLTTALILAQIFRICSALGSGITLMSLSAGAAIAASTLKVTGIHAATNRVMQWSQNKMRGTHTASRPSSYE